MELELHPTLAKAVTTDPACPYHQSCRCYQQTRYEFYFGYVGQQGDYDHVGLTREGLASVMEDLIRNPRVNRMWIQVDGQSPFMWFSPNHSTRIGDWYVNFEGMAYCFSWDTSREEVHCSTLGEWFGPIDCFGARRWSTHLGAVLWTLDNIDKIAERVNA